MKYIGIIAVILLLLGGYYYAQKNPNGAAMTQQQIAHDQRGSAPSTDAGIDGSTNQGNLGATSTGEAQRPGANGLED